MKSAGMRSGARGVVVRVNLVKMCDILFGFTALELMMVLAVIAVATVAIIRTMGANSDKANVGIMVTDITALAQNIKSAYSSSAAGYSGLDTQTAINLKVVPTDLQIGSDQNSTIKSQFQGGTVTIANTDDSQNFTITYDNVPSSVCQQAISQVGGAFFQSITIGANEVYNAVDGKALDPKEVGQNCSDAKNKATIIFKAS